jgi:hypothetical protein
MTDTAPTTRSTEGGSRALRAVVIVVVLVAALALFAWWSGAVGARVEVRQGAHEFFAETGQGEVVADVHNLGLVPIEVRAVYLQPDRGWVREVSSDRLRLGPRESGELVVIYLVDCELWDEDQQREPIAIEARPSVGWADRTPIRLDGAVTSCERSASSGPTGTDD